MATRLTTKLIKFRLLFAELSIDEEEEFILTTHRNNKDIIICSLFHYLLNDESINDINNIIKTVSNIIESRKKKSKSDIDETQKLELNTMPKPLIGFTASFLNQNDYINFSKTSRAVYLGCNSPNLLEEMNLTWTKCHHFHLIEFKWFRYIKTLKLNIDEIEEILFFNDNLSTINNLKCLELDADDITDDNMDDLNEIINNKMNNINNLRKLSFSFFGEVYKRYNTLKFIQILQSLINNNQHIEGLILHNIYISNIIDTDSINLIKEKLPKLNYLSISLMDNENMLPFITAFSSKLKYLQFQQNIDLYNNDDFNLNYVDFPNLEELYIKTPSLKTMDKILEKIKKIKTLRISISELDECNMRRKEVEEIMIKIMKNPLIKRVEYIFDSIDCILFEHCLIGIDNGLDEILFYNHDVLDITIVLEGTQYAQSMKKSVSMIRKIVSKMLGLTIKDWVLSFNIYDITSNELDDIKMDIHDASFDHYLSIQNYRNDLKIQRIWNQVEMKGTLIIKHALCTINSLYHPPSF